VTAQSYRPSASARLATQAPMAARVNVRWVPVSRRISESCTARNWSSTSRPSSGRNVTRGPRRTFIN